MKITHICLNNFYVDNMEYQENVLPRKHMESGYEVNIITSRYGFDNNGLLSRKVCTYNNENNIPVTVLDYKYNARFKRAVGLYSGLRERLADEKPDIIFVHGILFLSFQDVIDYKSLNPKVKIYADSHIDYINCPVNGLKHKLQFAFWRKKIVNWIPRIEKIWGVTPQRVEFLKKELKIPLGKTDFLPMGGDEKYINFSNKDKIRCKILEKYNIKENSFIISTGGKIDKKKNIHLLLQAIKEIYDKKMIENIVLIVFGKVEDDIMNNIEEYSKEPFVRMIGWKKPQEIYDIFISSNLCVFPGTHSVLWEQAVACGCPCVFKHWDNMHHVDIGGNCMFLYKDVVDEIKDIIYSIVENNEKYLIMKNISFERGPKIFSYKKIASKAIEANKKGE